MAQDDVSISAFEIARELEDVCGLDFTSWKRRNFKRGFKVELRGSADVVMHFYRDDSVIDNLFTVGLERCVEGEST